MNDLATLSAPRLLEGVPESVVRTDPFAHLVLKPAVTADQFAELERGFPTLEKIAGAGPWASNRAVRLNATQVLSDSTIPGIWRDFFAHHVSGAYWRDVVRLFGGEMRRLFPGLEAKVGRPLEEWRVVRRGSDEPHDIRLDCQFVVNTPVTEVSSVKGAHIDVADKIFSALFYFRDRADDSAGGNLELYRWKREPRFVKHKTLDRDVEKVTAVPYAANTFVAFVNSPFAVHGVSPRGITPIPRRYINFIAELPEFFYEPQQVTGIARLWHRLTDRSGGGGEEKY